MRIKTCVMYVNDFKKYYIQRKGQSKGNQGIVQYTHQLIKSMSSIHLQFIINVSQGLPLKFETRKKNFENNLFTIF